MRHTSRDVHQIEQLAKKEQENAAAAMTVLQSCKRTCSTAKPHK